MRCAEQYDPAPVLELAHRQASTQLGRRPADHDIADLLGVSRRTVLRWRHGTSRPDVWMCDRLAIGLGAHPCEMWPGWFDEAV